MKTLFAALCLTLLGSPLFAQGLAITSVTPTLTAGTQSQTVIVTGTGFEPKATSTLRSSLGVVSNVTTYVSSKQLTVTAAFNIVGAWTLRVKVRQKQSNIFAFVVVAPTPTPVPPVVPSTSDSLNPGALSLSATFEAISVRAKFSGDANGNATALVQFRKQVGDLNWHSAYAPYIDRRAVLDGTPNPYANEARVPIVGLVPDTLYNVQVTWSDPDGVTGSPVAASVSTLSYSPPTGGGTVTVTDDASLALALNGAVPGQTIHLNAGVYGPFSIVKSGTSAAWIVIEGDPAAVVSGTGVDRNLSINANYVIVRGLTLGASDASGIVLASGVHHVFVQDNTLAGISTKCALDPHGHYGDTGIAIGNDAANIFVLRNVVHAPALNNATCTLVPPWDSPGTGISWGNASTLVVKGNTVTDGFRDAISSDSSYGVGENIDVTGNTVSGYKDDGIESKGTNINVRLASNVIVADAGDSCIAGNTNTTTNAYGPLWIFRNACVVTTSNPYGATAYKLGGAPTFLFHNSVDSSKAGTHWDTYVSGTAITALNNVAKSSGSMVDYVPATSTFDYNLGVVTSGASFAYLWNSTTTYATFADFRLGTSQEAHGLNVDPMFADPALHLAAGSPALDRGAVLPNFNSSDSAWPFAGTAPDMGAWERP